MGYQHNKELAVVSGKKSKRGPAKITKDIKQMIADLTSELYYDVFNNLSELGYYHKANLLSKLFEYQTPKMRSTEYKTDVDSMSDAQIDLITEKLMENE